MDKYDHSVEREQIGKPRYERRTFLTQKIKKKIYGHYSSDHIQKSSK